MRKSNKHSKSQVSGFYVHFLRIDFYKLFLNLLVLSFFGFIIWSALKLFSQEFFNSPLIGSLVFLAEIVGFVFLCRHIRANYWRPPSIIRTILYIAVVIFVFAFAGVHPVSDYKDEFATNVSTFLKSSNNQSGITSTVPENENTQTSIQDINKSQATPSPISADASKTDYASSSAKIEKDVVNLVNNIRASRNTSTLVWDDKLYTYSKSHSEEMATQKQLFHTNAGMPYAENCWGGEGSTSWTANTIVDSWMNSDFHRTWLLCPNLKHIAVGIAISDNGMYASWTFWVGETDYYTDWWYCNGSNKPPQWWY